MTTDRLLGRLVGDMCTQCKKRRVEPDQVGKSWRVCPRCQANPHLNYEERLARKLGMISAEVTKEKKIAIEIDWFKIILVAVTVMFIGFLLVVDWNMSSEIKTTMIDLLLAIIPLLIIVVVMSSILSIMKRRLIL